MSFQRLLAGAACAVCTLGLVSCGFGGGAADLKYPTVSEMDSMDVQWGLEPRKSRGAPKRSYQVPGSVGADAPSMIPPRETVNAPPPASAAQPAAPAEPALDPARINNLR